MDDVSPTAFTLDPRHRVRIVLLLALLTSGCWNKPKPLPPEKVMATKTATIHVPPKDLVKAIAQNFPNPPLSLPVESVQDGTIFTDWKEYEGEVHIVRRWRERTRFRITVSPDFNDPLKTSHVEVFEETEEKPSDPQPWYPNPDLRRPERSAEVLKAIEDSATTKPAQ